MRQAYFAKPPQNWIRAKSFPSFGYIKLNNCMHGAVKPFRCNTKKKYFHFQLRLKLTIKENKDTRSGATTIVWFLHYYFISIFQNILAVFHLKQISFENIWGCLSLKIWGCLHVPNKLRSSFIFKQIEVVFHFQKIEVVFHFWKIENVFHLKKNEVVFH